MTCKISTLDKKSIIVTEYFYKNVGDETYNFNVETVWRWGYVIVEENANDIDSISGELNLDNYSIIDQELSDGTSCYWNFSDNVPDEVRDEIEAFCEEHDYTEIEELGWIFSDTETVFLGDIEIEQIDDTTEDVVPSTVASDKPTWPFS